MKERDILHQTENLSLIKSKTGLEIRLEGATHALVVGAPDRGVDRAIVTMDRMENDIDQLRKIYSHYR